MAELMSPTIGSVFSGVGGLDLGVEAATDGRVIWHAENDPYAASILAQRWPDSRIYSRVQEIDETTPRPDIICGGFPCQDISVAGLCAGIEGDKSGLWGEFARILGVLRPRYAFIENVPNLAAHGLVRVLADLAALGLDAEWDVIGACCVGAPHRRERMFILAGEPGRIAPQITVPNTERVGVREQREWQREQHGEQRAAEPCNDGEEGPMAPDPDRVRVRGETRTAAREEHRLADNGGQVRTLADTNRDGALESQWSLGEVGGWTDHRSEQARRHWASEPDVGRVAHDVPFRAHRLRCLGNAVVPAQAEAAFRILSERFERPTP